MLERLKIGFKADWIRTDGFQKEDPMLPYQVLSRKVGSWTRIHDVIEKVVERSSFSRDVLTGSGRPTSVCPWRQMVYYIATRKMGRGYSEVGRLMGKDHTTVMSGAAKFERLLVGRFGSRWMNRLDMVLKDLA